MQEETPTWSPYAPDMDKRPLPDANWPYRSCRGQCSNTNKSKGPCLSRGAPPVQIRTYKSKNLYLCQKCADRAKANDANRNRS
jgi:hypothetical protein